MKVSEVRLGGIHGAHKTHGGRPWHRELSNRYIVQFGKRQHKDNGCIEPRRAALVQASEEGGLTKTATEHARLTVLRKVKRDGGIAQMQ